MRTMISGAVLLTLLSQLLVVFPASAARFSDDPVPAPGQVFVEIVTVNGSGCRPRTFDVALAPDNMAFTVNYYGDYVARVGVGATPVDFRKNCQLGLAVRVPDGFTYAVAEVEFRGFASLAAGATAMLRGGNYFQGFPSSMQTYPFAGPFEDEWHIVDGPDIEPMFNPCGDLRDLGINTELRVAVGTSDPTTTGSVLAMDSPVGTTYHLAWQRCPDGR